MEIVELGDINLRKKSKEIKNISLKSNRKLFKEMIDIIEELEGVGVAAPQINIRKRVFVMHSRPNKRYPNAPTMKPLVVINPVILKKYGSIKKDWEGCLSIPGIRARVPRYDIIDVEFYSVDKEKIVKKFNGFLARIFQHEYDHLEGKIFLDRVESMRDVFTEKEYFKKINNINSK